MTRSTPNAHVLVNVLLSCRHSQRYAPAPVLGDVVYCRRCADYRRVIADVINWHAKCQGCNMGRYTGSDESRARRIAVRHSNKFGHIVEVYERKGADPDIVSPPGNDLVTMSVEGSGAL